MELVISLEVRKKLAVKHGIQESDILECFSDCAAVLLTDDREGRKTDPPTQWFIGETDHGQRLKVVFIFKDGNVILKTAYPPNQEEERIYAKFAKK